MGLYRLLIINSYKSYNLLDFQQIYKDSKIITLYIPPYSSYLLQLLDIGCFSPLKRVYSAKINALIRAYIYYINK